MFKASLRVPFCRVPLVSRTSFKISTRQAVQINFRRHIITTHFTEDHEYIKFDSDTSTGVVGITDYAQKALGDVVFVELPAVAGQFKQGELIGAVESVKAASDIYAPVSGTVVEVNEQLNGQPGLLNKNPYESGWLCKVKLSTTSELDGLMNEEAYKAHCEES